MLGADMLTYVIAKTNKKGEGNKYIVDYINFLEWSEEENKKSKVWCDRSYKK